MIQKMQLVTVTGMDKDVAFVTKALIATGLLNFEQAKVGLEGVRKNYDKKWGMPKELLTARPKALEHDKVLATYTDKLEAMIKYLKISEPLDVTSLEPKKSRADLYSDIDKMYANFASLNDKITSLIDKYEYLRQLSTLSKLESVAFNLKKLKDLKHFDIRLGAMSHEYQKRLKMNYENINTLVIEAGELDGTAVYFFISPKMIASDTDALLRSMHVKTIPIEWDYLDFPQVAMRKIHDEQLAVQDELNQLGHLITAFGQEHNDHIIKLNTHLQLEKRLDDHLKYVYVTDRHFLVCAWLPLGQEEAIKKALRPFSGRVNKAFIAPEALNTSKVPTALKNSRLWRPFETLVLLYGTPSYHESDPTQFLALVYMVLFGAMFGDVGQGLVFLLAGVYIGYKKQASPVGGILKRIGLSSMAFGFVYDSIFGIEHLLSDFVVKTLGLVQVEGLFLRPIENTNTMLAASVVLGIVLLLISYGYSIVNKLRRKEIIEGVFGRNGINGLILFVGLLALLALSMTSAADWMIRLSVFIVLISVGLLIVREPLGNLITKKRPLYHEGVGTYYTESAFEVLETFLSLLSNGISFIRVGAFALNHVGLLIAFHTIADMIGSAMGNVAMFIVGNVVVIALEGLIVFIQGLRLVYYELFSKYYQGDGVAFVKSEV